MKRPNKTAVLTATLIPCSEGGFTAICNEIRGAVSEGETKEEALTNLRDAVKGVLEVNAEISAENRRATMPRGRARGTQSILMDLCEAI